jgi:hypothetical protein
VGKLVAALKGPEGIRLVSTAYQGLPFDLIQEWGFSRSAIKTLAELPNSEGSLAAEACQEGKAVIIQAGGKLHRLDVENESLTGIGVVPLSLCLLMADGDSVYGLDEDKTLWRYHPSSNTLERKVVRLPEGCQVGETMRWAHASFQGRRYLADAAGNLYPFTLEKGFGPTVGKTRLAPVGSMAVTHDGRMIGSCGDGIGRLFVSSPREGQVKDIGVAVSILERRRYGYQFGDAVTGRDGEIYFGERDNSGHLWIYFPRIERSIV